MAFVNEKIPEKYWEMVDSWKLLNSDKKEFEARRISTLSNGEIFCDVKSWTADYEKQAYLICVAYYRLPDSPHFDEYVLIWNENKIVIKCEVRYLGDAGKRYGEYKVFHIEIPKVLKDQKEECFEIIKEALWTKSQMGPECGRRPVTVYITEEPIFI